MKTSANRVCAVFAAALFIMAVFSCSFAPLEIERPAPAILNLAAAEVIWEWKEHKNTSKVSAKPVCSVLHL